LRKPTNQPTNQTTPLRASSYLPRLKLPPALHGSKAPLARWLVRRMRDLCDRCWVGDIFLAFEKKIAIAIAIAICVKHVRDRFCLSRYKTVWGASERHCISLSLPLLFGFFRRFFFAFVFFPFKARKNRVCTWLLVRTLRTYLLTYHVWHFF
jgi:hypothetical protein